VLAVGAGAPVTVVGHGLGASYDETRPLVGGLPGTRVLHRFRGHGDAPLGAGPVSWELLGRDLLATADEVGATRAIGVSLGAGALLALLAEHPDRFERVVLLLPAALDQARPVERALALVDALETGSEEAVLPLVLDELPPEQRETLELAYFGGLSQTEIAERTGSPLGTVKTRMRLAMQKLRGRLTTLREGPG
jgi:3-oxoadipate enol-lactonase